MDTSLHIKTVGRLLLACVLLILTGCSRPKSESVAMVGSESISAVEFRARYSFSTYIFHSTDPATNKRHFLQSLIWEKRLAQEARRQGLAERPFYKQQMGQLHKEALWEAYYQKHHATAADPEQALRQAIRRLMTGKTMHISKESFAELESALQLALGKPAQVHSDSIRRVSERDLATMQARYQALLSKPLVSFGPGEIWTTADLLQRLATGPYPLPPPEAKTFAPALKHAIRRAAELEQISRAATAEGLDKTDFVQAQMQMWSSALLSQTLIQDLNNEANISEQDIADFYNLHRDRYQTAKTDQPLDSVRTRILHALRQEKTAARLRDKLLALNTQAIVHDAVLDTLQVKQSADVVLKRHFPGRVLAPLVFPFADIMPPTP